MLSDALPKEEPATATILSKTDHCQEEPKTNFPSGLHFYRSGSERSWVSCNRHSSTAVSLFNQLSGAVITFVGAQDCCPSHHEPAALLLDLAEKLVVVDGIRETGVAVNVLPARTIGGNPTLTTL